MFREMRRFKQALTEEECRAVLRGQVRGVLSVLGQDGYPYGMPLDYWYNEDDGRLYFHGAREGHKLDAIRACDKVSFCVVSEGQRVEGEWPLRFCSVVIFGRLAPVTDPAQTENICRRLAERFTDDAAYIDAEIEAAKERVLCLALTPEHMTGKRVKES